MSIDIKEFNIAQQKQIEAGLTYLSEEEILIYAKPEFSPLRMQEIRMALEFKLDKSIINKLLSNDLSDNDVRLLRINSEKYGKDEPIYTHIDKNYTNEVANLLKDRLSNKKISVSDLKFFNTNHQLHQATAICYALENKFSDEYMNLLKDLDLTPNDLKILIDAMKKDYPLDVIKCAREASLERMTDTLKAYDNGVKVEVITFLSDKNYSSQIINSLYDISFNYDFEIIKKVTNLISNHIDNFKDIQFKTKSTNLSYTVEELDALSNAVKSKIDEEVLQKLSNPQFSARAIRLLTRSYLNDDEKLFTCICDPLITAGAMKKIREVWLSEKYSVEQLCALKSVKEERIDLAIKAFDYKLSEQQMLSSVNIDLAKTNTPISVESEEREILETIKLYVKENITSKHKGMDDRTIELIDKTLSFDFSYDDIMLFVDGEYDYDKRREIVLCIIDEVPLDTTFPDGFKDLAVDKIKEIRRNFNISSFKENKMLDNDFLDTNTYKTKENNVR